MFLVVGEIVSSGEAQVALARLIDKEKPRFVLQTGGINLNDEISLQKKMPWMSDEEAQRYLFPLLRDREFTFNAPIYFVMGRDDDFTLPGRYTELKEEGFRNLRLLSEKPLRLKRQSVCGLSGNYGQRSFENCRRRKPSHILPGDLEKFTRPFDILVMHEIPQEKSTPPLFDFVMKHKPKVVFHGQSHEKKNWEIDGIKIFSLPPFSTGIYLKMKENLSWWQWEEFIIKEEKPQVIEKNEDEEWTSRSDGRFVPRPEMKHFSGLFEQIILGEWKDYDEDYPWLKKLRRIAGEYGCRIVFDKRRTFDVSFHSDENKYCPVLYIGGQGEEKEVCTVILHELAHHYLFKKSISPRDYIKREKLAWKTAAKIASENRLPFDRRCYKAGLHSYKRGLLLLETTGSKHKRRRRPEPKSWKLEKSKRSEAITFKEQLSIGKKGKRYAKKFIKRATSKAERRNHSYEEE